MLLLLLSLPALPLPAAAAAAARTYSVIEGWNAVPSGKAFTVKSAASCREACDAKGAGCLQWTFNEHSNHHCFLSGAASWGGTRNGHTSSGCVVGAVAGCPAAPGPAPPAPPPPAHAPYWTAPKPDAKLPLAGYSKIPGVTDVGVYLPRDEADGMYNHAAMIAYFNGTFVLSWKNAPLEEDTAGQRVLYSTSADGQAWTKAAVLFPNMSTTANPAADFAGPFAVINGRLYASATPAVIADGDAQGGQFCLWPDGLDPRNCATPDRPGTQPKGLLLMRQVGGYVGAPLGDVFWASRTPPEAFAPAAAANGVKALQDMDAATQADIQQLVGRGVGDGFEPPCDVAAGSGTLKCEGCRGGCETYATKSSKGLGLANERTHYAVPGTAADTMLFRAHTGTLWASVRSDGGASQSNWSAVFETTLPNDDSNLNAGMLPDQRGVYLFSNAAPMRVRDPLTVSLSADGANFSACLVAQTCTDLLGGRSTCRARQKKNTNVGPSYPQGLTVVAPAPAAVRGLYVVATNNKEDVIVSRIPWEALPF